MGGLYLGDLDFAPVDLDAYFARIGYTGSRTATLATLQALHRLHPASIPFETLDVFAREAIHMNAEALDAKLIHAGRGGYCFEQNTLFLRVLRTLDFKVEPLIARSRWARSRDRGMVRTHMALRVRLDGVDWLADVGFGACMLTTPLRMDVHEAQATHHEAARLVPIDGELRLEYQISGEWLPIYDLVVPAATPADLLAANWLISTHPDSGFHQNLVVTRTRDAIRHVLVNAQLTIRHADGQVERRELDADAIAVSLLDDFGISLRGDWSALLKEAAARPKP
ncbi:arylamine N-acetyltransferase [Uliginosibacterium sp. H3]|uniref:Arylamine N-acetyltransferase n=1 Tax=Uliginosibacterium silvisoli TaxID=3114758 RepID=A0ABU6K7L4_9RHOO|nr:arylamine N-acetyltransferase [Uliginosibacterium sp. H3]